MRQNKNYKIAITGGIGSGKSTVAKILKEKNYPVFSCDETYAQLVKDKNFLNILANEFGDILDVDGNLDRTKLSAVVFSKKEKLKKLNEITHPKIFEEMFKNAETFSGICFFEVPLLFEEGNEKFFDNVIVVLRDLETRISFVVSRDKINKDEVQARIKNQYNYENCNFAKYYVIHNDGNLADLSNEIECILTKINNKI
jgi:dephospho-CoA kinase